MCEFSCARTCVWVHAGERVGACVWEEGYCCWYWRRAVAIAELSLLI